MNKPIAPKNLESNNISLWEIQIFLSQMMKYYAIQGFSFDKKSPKSLYYFIDFNVGIKICEEKEYQKGSTESYLNQIWQSLVYIWEKNEIKLDDFFKYIEKNTTEDSWYDKNSKRKNKGALEHLVDFVGKDKAYSFNNSLVYISRESNNISGLQYNEDYKDCFGKTPRERTINYIKHLQSYFENLRECYEEHYVNTDFPTCKNWNIV